MKLMESSSGLLAGLFLAALCIEVSFLPGDLSVRCYFPLTS